MNRQLLKIREELEEMNDKEAVKLFRLARKARNHGVDKDTVNEILEEARFLISEGQSYPERVLEWDFEYRKKYAYKF